MSEGKKTRTETQSSNAAARNPRWTTVLLLFGIVISIGLAVAVGYLFERQLIVWIIRVTAGILAVFFLSLLIRRGYRQTRIEDQRAQQALKIENQRAEAEQELATQRPQDEVMQAYLDQISSLLRDKNRLLHHSKDGDEFRILERARTLTVLERMDPSHKTAVMQFLVEVDLVQGVNGRKPIITLNGANLSEADLRDANLSRADLSNANLFYANLFYANLQGADLQGADLKDVNLSRADLREADLRYANMEYANLQGADLQGADLQGAIMPDGSKHP